MICLDTNYLIRGLIPDSREANALKRWCRAGEVLIAPAVVWYEFLCGPVTAEQIHTIRLFLSGNPIGFNEAEATEAARLFNAVKRLRGLRVDAMIAATAIVAEARLATDNKADFKAFAAYGLKFVTAE